MRQTGVSSLEMKVSTHLFSFFLFCELVPFFSLPLLSFSTMYLHFSRLCFQPIPSTTRRLASLLSIVCFLSPLRTPVGRYLYRSPFEISHSRRSHSGAGDREVGFFFFLLSMSQLGCSRRGRGFLFFFQRVLLGLRHMEFPTMSGGENQPLVTDTPVEFEK